MAWVRVEDNFPEHPKVLAAGGEAAWLYICALTYANRFRTDGFVPTAALGRISDREDSASLAERLVVAHLWDVTEGGWVIHDYLEYQRSREEIDDENEKARQRMAAKRSPKVRANIERSTDVFDEFWACYPRKVAKPVAHRAFANALEKVELSIIVDGLAAWCGYWKARGDTEFVPYPATWLNQERWNDRPPKAGRRNNAGIQQVLDDMSTQIIETRER